MADRKQLEAKLLAHDFSDFKWIDPSKIVISHWVRMKCMFGCDGYGTIATCPPNVPSFSECEKFFSEYKDAVIFHFERKFDDPEDRRTWYRESNLKLLELEREIFV